MRCRHGAWEPACAECKPIYSSRDQLWYFTYPFKPNDRVDIHSKGQFLAECKKRKLCWTGYDDLVKNGKPYHASDRPLDLTKVQPVLERIVAESHDTGRVERHWQELKTKEAIPQEVG